MHRVVSREAGERINALWRERKQAIKIYQYERAQSLEQEMGMIKAEALDQYTRKVEDELTATVTACIERFHAACAVVNQEIDEKAQIVKLRFHTHFQALQGAHRLELQASEKKFSDARIRETLRSIPAFDDVMDQSRKAADTSQYKEAIELRDNSRAAARAFLEKRLAAAEDSFVAVRQNLFDKFRKQIKDLSAKFNMELDALDDKREMALKKEEENNSKRITAIQQTAGTKLAQAGQVDAVRLVADVVDRVLRGPEEAP